MRRVYSEGRPSGAYVPLIWHLKLASDTWIDAFVLYPLILIVHVIRRVYAATRPSRIYVMPQRNHWVDTSVIN